MPRGYVGRPFGRPGGVPLPVFDELLPFYEIHGKQGDAVRHWLARAAFMRELCTHPRVVDTFNRWVGVEEGGVNAAARELADARDAYARAHGFTSRADMLRPDFADVELRARIEKPAEAERLQALLGDAEEVYIRATRTAHMDPTPLARDLVEPGWPWVVQDLIGAFYRGVLSRVFGVPIVLHVRIKHHGARAWLLEMGCTVGDPILEVVPVGDGSRLPDENVAAIERNARWLYRARVAGETIYSIAKSADVEGIDVRKGIKETDRLLALTGYAWGEGN